MMQSLTFHGQLSAFLLGLTLLGCSSEASNGTGAGGTSANTSSSVGGGTGLGTVIGGATAVAGAPCTLPPSTERRHPGTYDYKTCSAAGCHDDSFRGGWIYTTSTGEAYVDNATVTLTNSDNTTITSTTASDGFFHLVGAVTSTFTPCVSRCAEKTCATVPHTNNDCQNATCHGGANKLIYVGSGQGTAPVTGANCIAPSSVGPRAHDPSFDEQVCTTCHEPGYLGGYVYNGISSNTPVSMATITITPQGGGAPITAVSGPGGLFQIKGTLTAPYTACVSKCPTATVCSSAISHNNTDDCATCHTAQLRVHLP